MIGTNQERVGWWHVKTFETCGGNTVVIGKGEAHVHIQSFQFRPSWLPRWHWGPLGHPRHACQPSHLDRHTSSETEATHG